MKPSLVVAALALAASPAVADTKSWAVLQSHVPANAEILVGVDLKPLRASASFAKAVENIPDIGMALGLVKQTCAIDVVTAISDVSVALKIKGPDEVVFAVGLDGVDEAKVIDCATKLLKTMNPKAKVTAKSGKVTEYVVDDGEAKKTTYAIWAAKDVVVFAQDPEDKSKLDGFVNGKAAQGDLSGYLGKASTTAVAWIAATIGEEHMKGAYGTLTLAKGTFTASGHVVTDSRLDALKLSKEGAAELKLLQSRAGTEMQKVLSAIKLATAAADVTIDGVLADADLLAALPALLK
jgi:hypothetical protein